MEGPWGGPPPGANTTPWRTQWFLFIGALCWSFPAGGGDHKWRVSEGEDGKADYRRRKRRDCWLSSSRTVGAQTPPSGVAEVSAAHRALLGHTV
jgi:hypothetical protein